jgi:hypothetical protein
MSRDGRRTTDCPPSARFAVANTDDTDEDEEELLEEDEKKQLRPRFDAPRFDACLRGGIKMLLKLGLVLLIGLPGCLKRNEPASSTIARSPSSSPAGQSAADRSLPLKKAQLRGVPIFFDSEPSALRTAWRPLALRELPGKANPWVTYLSVEYTLISAKEVQDSLPYQLPRNTQNVLLFRVKDTSNRTLLWVTLELMIGDTEYTVDVVDTEYRPSAGKYGYIMFHDIGPVNAEINMSARVRKCVHK